MVVDLEPIKKILRALLKDIEKVKLIQQNFSEPKIATAFSVHDQQPIIDSSEYFQSPELYWEKENAYALIHAEAWHFRAFMHTPNPHLIPFIKNNV